MVKDNKSQLLFVVAVWCEFILSLSPPPSLFSCSLPLFLPPSLSAVLLVLLSLLLIFLAPTTSSLSSFFCYLKHQKPLYKSFVNNPRPVLKSKLKWNSSTGNSRPEDPIWHPCNHRRRNASLSFLDFFPRSILSGLNFGKKSFVAEEHQTFK